MNVARIRQLIGFGLRQVFAPLPPFIDTLCGFLYRCQSILLILRRELLLKTWVPRFKAMRASAKHVLSFAHPFAVFHILIILLSESSPFCNATCWQNSSSYS